MKKTQFTERSLRRNYLFAALTDEQFTAVMHGMRHIELDDGDILFDDQQPARRFFMLVSGQVKLFRLAASGTEKVIAIVQPGEFFATAVMFMEEPNYPVSATTIQQSHLLSFENRAFLQILRNSPDTCFRLMADMSRRLRRQVNEIDSLCLQNASYRMVRYFLNQVAQSQDVSTDTAILQLSVPKNVIASQLSIQPETFSRILRTLKSKDLIAVDNKEIRIPSLSALEAYGDSCEMCRATLSKKAELRNDH